MPEVENEGPGRRKYPSHPLVGVGAVAIKDGKILLVRRAFEPGAGRWSIPGGLVELGETMSEACAREMEEETGLKVEVLEQIRAFDLVDKDEQGRIRYDYVLVDFLVRVVGGEPRASPEVTESRWVSYEESKTMEMTNSARKALEELFGGP